LGQLSSNRLKGIGILTDKGVQIGQLRDIVIDEGNGKVLALCVKLAKGVTLQGLQKDEGGNPLIPFSAVLAMRDYIVVNERALAIQMAKVQQTLPVQPAVPSPPVTPAEGQPQEQPKQ
jgi:sporulation protein YlmC with PRC-barrel domain